MAQWTDANGVFHNTDNLAYGDQGDTRYWEGTPGEEGSATYDRPRDQEGAQITSVVIDSNSPGMPPIVERRDGTVAFLLQQGFVQATPAALEDYQRRIGYHGTGSVLPGGIPSSVTAPGAYLPVEPSQPTYIINDPVTPTPGGGGGAPGGGGYAPAPRASTPAAAAGPTALASLASNPALLLGLTLVAIMALGGKR